jgi:hypothetical protein
VTGQDIEATDDGRFRIFEGTAPDRVVSTVDPQARQGTRPPPRALMATRHMWPSTRRRGDLCRRGQPGSDRRRGRGPRAAWRPG